MIVLFYDRKNKRQVRSDELISIKLHRTIVVCDDDELEWTGRRQNPETFEYLGPEYRTQFQNWLNWEKEMVVKYPYPSMEKIGSFGYICFSANSPWRYMHGNASMTP